MISKAIESRYECRTGPLRSVMGTEVDIFLSREFVPLVAIVVQQKLDRVRKEVDDSSTETGKERKEMKVSVC